MNPYLILAISWIGWCVVHSALISLCAVNYLQKWMGPAFRYYRLFYNAVALVTFIPIAAYERSLGGSWIFRWEGAAVLGRACLLFVAAVLFVGGARHYDLRRFIGLRQLGEQTRKKGLAGTGHLHTTGILGATRHPWYAGAIALVWTRDIDGAVLVTNAIVTAYILVGTILEERKLVAEYGAEYRAYQKRVPMLLPLGFLSARSGKNNADRI